MAFRNPNLISRKVLQQQTQQKVTPIQVQHKHKKKEIILRYSLLRQRYSDKINQLQVKIIKGALLENRFKL